MVQNGKKHSKNSFATSLEVSEWVIDQVSIQMNKRSRAREQSKKCWANKQVSSASKQGKGLASSSVLLSGFLVILNLCEVSRWIMRVVARGPLSYSLHPSCHATPLATPPAAEIRSCNKHADQHVHAYSPYPALYLFLFRHLSVCLFVWLFDW